jgi:hypothetical protein
MIAGCGGLSTTTLLHSMVLEVSTLFSSLCVCGRDYNDGGYFLESDISLVVMSLARRVEGCAFSLEDYFVAG